MKLYNLIKNIKIDIVKIIKIAVGSSIAIFIANFFGLMYSASAGIITLLSIQNTKKETFQVAIRRFLAFLLAILIAYILFETFGYNTAAFGVFLLLFISFSYLFGLQDGVSMCSVLVTHFLIEQNMKPLFIGNEIAIMIIGIIVGIVLNLYMPNMTKMVKEDIRLLEEDMKIILNKLADCILKERVLQNKKCKSNSAQLMHQCSCSDTCSLEDNFNSLDKHLKDALARAYENMNNTLLSDTRYYIQYFMMRRNQYNTLIRIKDQLCLLTAVPKQAVTLSEFLYHISEQFNEYNSAEVLLMQLDQIKEGYKSEENPKTREEFENRAVLYLILNDIETFLFIKRNFILATDKNQIEGLWKPNHK
jgi:uncharacterized membrane protein YgaE (UPF0421/DUF939 family)